MPLSKLIVCFPKIVKAPYTTVKNLYKGIIFLGIVVEVFSCTEYPFCARKACFEHGGLLKTRRVPEKPVLRTEYSFRTRKACFLHRMLQKTLRVPQEAVLRTESQFRTVGGRFRYRMHILYHNITFICNDSEKGATAGSFMMKLIRPKKKYFLTTIVIAHTPKRRGWEPITQNDLAGSAKLINFFDAVILLSVRRTMIFAISSR